MDGTRNKPLRNQERRFKQSQSYPALNNCYIAKNAYTFDPRIDKKDYIEKDTLVDRVQGKFSAKQTLIIFDWDDTILPTSWLKSQGIINKKGKRYNRIDPISNEELRTQLVCMANEANLTLKEAMQQGTVMLITNASQDWIPYSCNQFLPDLWATVKKLKVISAKESIPHPHYDSENTENLKTIAFKSAVSEFFNDSRSSNNITLRRKLSSASCPSFCTVFNENTESKFSNSQNLSGHNHSEDIVTNKNANSISTEINGERNKSNGLPANHTENESIIPSNSFLSTVYSSVHNRFVDYANGLNYTISSGNNHFPITNSQTNDYTSHDLNIRLDDPSFLSTILPSSGECKNIISIGDSSQEREAMLTIAKCLPQDCIKSLRLLDRPNLDQLKSQHIHIRQCLGRFVQYNRNFTDLKLVPT